MKTKRLPYLKFILIFFIAFLACLSIWYYVDITLNGTFLDWFSSHYMTTVHSTEASSGLPLFIRQPDWPGLKKLAFGLFVLSLFLFLGILFLVSHFYTARQVSKAITNANQMIHTYMSEEKEALDIFPKEYSEICAQMIEIKSTMQRHEQILKEEAEQKNGLITYLAHDLKTPLTSVIGYLSLLKEAPDMPELQRERFLKITLDKAFRLETLIDEFFEITRYNLQQMMLEKETIDLHYMLIQMTDEFFPLLKAHGNTISLKADEGLSLYGDPIKLARVFNNILKNAIAYSYENTPIEVLAGKAETEICIIFRNQGRTIPRQKLDAIFEKFYRLDISRGTNNGGAGLGLAIAREIVALHGGSVLAESENEVTSFFITLPCFNTGESNKN